jgi:EmrB/QacA subfamily drug resistance transporter
MGSRARLLVVLCSADVMVALDGTVVSVALPSIGRDLGLGGAGLQWVVTAYTLALGSFLLLGGRLADAFGSRRTLLAGLALFTAASAAACLARAPGSLLAARAAAGLGGALAIPAALSLVAGAFPAGRERDRALGWMSVSIDAAMVAGALVGGLVVSLLGWPCVFLVVVPLGVAALATAPSSVAPDRARPAARDIDVAGALLAAGGMGLLLVGLGRAQAEGPGAPVTLGTLAAAAALLALLVLVECRAADPILPARLLRRRRAAGACLAVVANAGAFGGVVVLSTLYMQRVLGMTPLQAGLGFLPLAISAAAGGPLAARLLTRLGARPVVVVSLLLTAAAVLALARAPQHGRYVTTLLPVFAVAGLTFATAAVPLTAEAVAEAGDEELGVAAGIFQTATHVGGAVVLAALTIVAAARTGDARDVAALLAGYRLAFALTAGLLVAGAATAAALLSRLRPARPCPATARGRAGRQR